jgi:aspartyl protease/PDZ domain-containing protein
MLNRRALFTLIVVGSLLTSAASVTTRTRSLTQATKPVATAAPVAIPFELVTRHIVLKVSVNNSRPLSFVLDTGDKYAVIDLQRAHELGLTLQGEVKMHGAGAETPTGAFVRDSSFTILGLPGFSQPVFFALPLARMAPRFGHDFDGIIGADFIKQFVLEVDYHARVIKLHDKDKFTYSGSGESIPLKLNSAGHPIIEAELTPMGSEPIKGKFVVDIGSGAALSLYSPFVAERRLLTPNLKTIKLIGAGGAGGKIQGQIGRVSELRIGKFRISKPLTLFSQDKAGAFASSERLGNIGAQIMNRFRIFLDYANDRMILEPSARFAEPFDPAFSGLSLQAEGTDYRTFRVVEVLENSPATEAGLQMNDIITGIDGRSAAELTLTKLNEIFERTTSYTLTVRRGEQTLQIKFTPRKLV